MEMASERSCATAGPLTSPFVVAALVKPFAVLFEAVDEYMEFQTVTLPLGNMAGGGWIGCRDEE